MPVQLTIHTTGADLVRQGLEDLSREVPRIGKQRIYEKLKRAQSKLRIPKSRPRSPIQWDSVRQLRKFYATDGFGRGIPTTRTNASLRWTITATGSGYTLMNPTDYASHLYGRYDGSGQSRIFRGEYPLFVDIVEQEIENLPQDIENHITYKAREKGF